jgi:purine-cytosine permease-like protein
MARPSSIDFASTDPVNTLDRAFGPTEYTALIASVTLGVPMLMAGLELVADDGLRLTVSQLVLAAPLGIVFGSAVLALVGWASAFNGVPTGLLLRPSLGIAGSWVFGVLHALLFLGWAAVELRYGGTALAHALAEMGVSGINEDLATVILAAVGTGLIVIGLSWVVRVWMRRFVFWVAIGIAVYALWRLLGDADIRALLDQPRTSGFWPGADLVLALAVLWFPLVGDTARFTETEGIAASSAGTGFGVPGLILVLVGGLAGLLGQTTGETVVGIGDYAMEGAASLAAVIVLAWVLVAQADQAFAYALSGTTSLSSITNRLGGAVVALVLVAAAAALGIFVTDETLLRSTRMILAVFGPVVAAFIADFFIVRRRDYLTDELYRAGGPYSGVNLIGLVSVLAGLVVYMLIDPVGPEVWTDIVEKVIPGGRPLGERFGMPAMIVSMLVSFAVYTGIGRWKIEEKVYISRVRV